MKIEIIPEVGDTFKIKTDLHMGFGFKNPSGGTGMSNWEHNKKYQGPQPVIQITNVWYDEEVGWRCWAKPLNVELKKYMDKVAHPRDKRIFVSQWDIEELNKAP
jgi:hypothetical protein